MKFERAIIRRSLDDPRVAQGERIQVEFDPEQLRRLAKEANAFLRLVRPLLGTPRRRRR